MIVVDASVLVDLLVGKRDRAAIRAALLRGAPWHAPHLIDVEVSQVLRRLSLAGIVGIDLAQTCVANLGQLPLTRHPHTALLNRIWQLRHNLSAYDGTYVALAEALGVPLLTRDARLAASGQHGATVQLV